MTRNKILIINIFGIGDVLFTTPLIRSIKQGYPQAFIGYVCNKRVFPLLADHPLIDKIYIYEKDDYRELFRKSKRRFVGKVKQSLSEIKKEGYDTFIDLSLNWMAGFFMKVIGIKERIGFNYKNRSPHLTIKIKTDGFERKHVIEHYLDVLKPMAVSAYSRKPEVFIKEEDRQWAREQLKQKKIYTSDLCVGVVPGGGASWGRDVKYRRWPPQRHAQLADKIVEKFSANIILLGDSSEKMLEEEVVKTMRYEPVSFIGKTTLAQYLALLAECDLVIVNDGGPLHMAVAAGVPTVSLIGTVSEDVYGPYPRQGHTVITKDIACRPCYHQFHRARCEHISCLNDITVDEVFIKVESVIKTIHSAQKGKGRESNERSIS